LKTLQIEEFIKDFHQGTLLDVRTPAEYEKAHIPGAKNLPLFSNEERAIIGTIYKQQGRQPAILKGLEITGPKMKDFIKKATELSEGSNKIFIYCWRGGMRSASMAWLLDLYGYEVYVLKRGYKAFRNFALNSFNEPRNLLVLGGKTGSGKTRVLYEIEKHNGNIIDLEGLAHHKGSAFGTIGENENCTQEHFENKLAMEWYKAKNLARVWIEDESRSIGKKIIPEGVWIQIRSAEVINLEIPLEHRISYLVAEYGKESKTELLESTLKIKKRLGGMAFKIVTESIENNELALAAGILLEYYDKAYGYGLGRREAGTVFTFETSEKDHAAIAKELLKFADTFAAKITNHV
jgi:tRNA 2-selenouridine synthase